MSLYSYVSEYDYHKIIRKLDDSLFRLKEMKQKDIGFSNFEKSRPFTAKSQYKTLTNKYHLKENDVNIDKTMETNRPFNDKYCINRYPIHCVSDNWEIIQCYISLNTTIEDDEKDEHHDVGKLSLPSDICSDFIVRLGHIRYASNSKI